MSSNKENKLININAGENEISLPSKLLNSLYDAIIGQLKGNPKNPIIDIQIDITYEEEIEIEIKEPLSNFNKSLKQALDFNPKAKKK